MPKKSLRDPNSPKRNLPAFVLYQNFMRNHFRAQNPGITFGQLAKHAAAMYAQLPPHEKEAWSQRAEADKNRYLHELSSYVPPPGYDVKGDFILSPSLQGPHNVMPSYGVPAGKVIKDKKAPKRNVSAYLLYQNAMRNQFKVENPDMTFGQLAKYTSHMYKNLSPEERATWDERARQDKLRYDAEIASYVPPPGHDALGNVLGEVRPMKRARRSTKDPGAPKRARGSFVCFTSEMRPIIMQENPSIGFAQMGKMLGERWRALTPEHKKRFEDIAATDKARYQMEMEKYKAAQASLQQAHMQVRAQAQSAMPIPAPAPANVTSMTQHPYFATQQQPTYHPHDPQVFEQQISQQQFQPQEQEQQQHLQVHQGQNLEQDQSALQNHQHIQMDQQQQLQHQQTQYMYENQQYHAA